MLLKPSLNTKGRKEGKKEKIKLLVVGQLGQRGRSVTGDNTGKDELEKGVKYGCL